MILYAIYYAHLRNGGIPSFPVTSVLSERLARALELFNSTFTIPFRIAFVLGLLLCPFVPRLRWFALPLYIAIATWANTAAYDLRNILSFLMVGAFVPLYVAAQRWLEPKAVARGRQWQARDGLVAAVLALTTFGLTSPLATSDERLQRRDDHVVQADLIERLPGASDIGRRQLKSLEQLFDDRAVHDSLSSSSLVSSGIGSTS